MSNQLLLMQWYQHCHDDRYHRDISHLPAMKRLNHLTHHMHKYVADLNRDFFIEDMFAVSLSMADVFPVSLYKYICKKENTFENAVDKISIRDLPIFYSLDTEVLLKQLNNHFSVLSKLIEGFDHVESIPYRDNINHEVCEIFILVYHLYRAMYKRQDTSELWVIYHKRLESIRQRNPFNDYFREQLSLCRPGAISSFDAAVRILES